MDSITPAAIAARVVAWHNRHPLARRITAHQVDGIGIVALPCAGLPLARREKIEPTAPPPDVPPDPAPEAAPEAAPEEAAPDAVADATSEAKPDAAAPATSAATDGAAPAGPATVFDVPVQADRALFSEAFIPGVSPRRVARWALRHATSERPGGADWPVRQVATDPALQQRSAQAGRSPTTLYLITAAIEGRDQRLRVLLGRTAADGALGARDWSPARMALAALLFTGLVFGLSAGALHLMRMRAAPDAAPATPPAHAPAPIAASTPTHAASPAQPASAAASAARGKQTDEEEVEVEIELPSPVASRAGAGAGAASAAASTAASAAASVPAHASAAAAAAQHGASKPQPPTSAPSRDVRAPPASGVSPAAKASAPATAAASAATTQAARAPAGHTAASSALQDAKAASASASAASSSVLAPYRVDRVAPALDPSLQHRLVQEGRALRSGVVPSAPAPRYYALVAKQTPTRAESETMLTRYKDTTAKLPRPAKGEVMQTGTTWRAAWWPFFTLEDAEAARKQFERRGAKQLEVVQF